MIVRRLAFAHLSLALAMAGIGASRPAAAAIYPANACVSTKQRAAGDYCKLALKARAGFVRNGDASKRDAALQAAATALLAGWTKADDKAAAKGTNCAETTLSVNEAQGLVDSAAGAIVADVNGDSPPADKKAAKCTSTALQAAAVACDQLLAADAVHIKALAKDPDGAKRAKLQAKAHAAFQDSIAPLLKKGCVPQLVQTTVPAVLDGLAANLLLQTIVSPNVDDAQFTTISPIGATPYLGKGLVPQCIHGTPYHFFVKRGSVNRLLMYYEGGGACWDALTCGVPVCTATAQSSPDFLNGPQAGFADRTNPLNPFRDWNIVFVSYCSCDVHFGDTEKDYSPTLHIEHRGYDNARIAEKWAREHFLDPQVVFVTGSSAGAYGAWFHAPLLQEVWSASRFHVLADAGNGVITQSFLDTSFPNWNFEANIPNTIPGIKEALNGTGLPGYTEAVAKFFPHTTWAQYATAYDGGSGGQTGFYNIMLNGNNPLAALTWWNGSCAFDQVMRQQAQATAAALTTNNNYRYYIGTGSRHTMWGSDKVYTDTTGGVPTLVDWVNATLASSPPSNDSPGWTDVSCTNCGLLLPGDPRPSPLQPPFEQVGSDVVVNCGSASGAFVE
jgi:hypothetical protein